MCTQDCFNCEFDDCKRGLGDGYLKNHPEKNREYQARYRENNPEIAKERSRICNARAYVKNREAILAKHKEYRDANRDRINARQREKYREKKECREL